MDDRPLSVGVLTPHVTAGPEIEIPAMSSGRVATLVARIQLPTSGGTSTSLEELRGGTLPVAVDRAAAAFPVGSVGALTYASTSSGYVIGFDAESALVERLRERWSLPVVSSSMAAVHALRAYRVERVFLVHPPWFDEQTSDLGAAYFRSQGFDAVAARADTLPQDPSLVRPGAVAEWVSRHAPDETEAVVLGGNGFRAAGALEQLERHTGRLVLQANQVLLWSVLAATRTIVGIPAYGRLLRENPAAPAPTTPPARATREPG